MTKKPWKNLYEYYRSHDFCDQYSNNWNRYNQISKDGLMHKTEKFNGHLALLIEMENGRRISRLGIKDIVWCSEFDGRYKSAEAIKVT